MTFIEVVQALTQLGTFDHGACDTILKARAIDIPNAYSPMKIGSEDSVYVGFAVIIPWLTVVAVMNWFSFKDRLWWIDADRRGLARWILPFMLLMGVVVLCAQSSGVAHYVATCRDLLRV